MKTQMLFETDNRRKTLLITIVDEFLPADGQWRDWEEADRFRMAMDSVMDLVAPSPEPPLLRSTSVVGRISAIAERMAEIVDDEEPWTKCENCEKPARCSDSEGVDLCTDCYAELLAETEATSVQERGAEVRERFEASMEEFEAKNTTMVETPVLETPTADEESRPDWCTKHNCEKKRAGRGWKCQECSREYNRDWHARKVAKKADAKKRATPPTTAVAKPANLPKAAPIVVDIAPIAEIPPIGATVVDFDAAVTPWNIEAFKSCVVTAATYKKAQDLGGFYVIKDAVTYRAVVQGLKDDANIVASFMAVTNRGGGFLRWQASIGLSYPECEVVDVPPDYYYEKPSPVTGGD